MVALLLCEPPPLLSQTTYSFEQVDRLQLTSPRLHLVFIHTEWCRFCKQMEAKTFPHPEVMSLLEDNYYFTSFSAESRDPVELGGRTFAYQATGRKTGSHELATILCTDERGRTGYPTIVLINAEREIIYRYSGWLGPEDLLKILRTGIREPASRPR